MNSISFFISRMFIWDDSLYGPTDLGIKNAILVLLPTHGITLDKFFNLSEPHMKTKVPCYMKDAIKIQMFKLTLSWSEKKVGHDWIVKKHKLRQKFHQRRPLERSDRSCV